MLIHVEQGDITTYHGDAIVNAGNNHLRLGAGVAGAIREKGGPTIQAECDRLIRDHGPIGVGEAVLTTAGDLSVRYVIHAAAMGDQPASQESIASATRASLELAAEHELSKIAFPVLGSGVGGFALSESARVMIEVMRNHEHTHPEIAVIYGFRPQDADAIRRAL